MSDEPAAYKPELGQMAFGNPWSPIDLELEFPQSTEYLSVLADLCGAESMWYATDFANETFEMRRYWWGDEDAPEASRPNFRCGDVQVRWYKGIGRGMTTNMHQSPDEWRVMFLKCFASIKEVADATHNSVGGRVPDA